MDAPEQSDLDAPQMVARALVTMMLVPRCSEQRSGNSGLRLGHVASLKTISPIRSGSTPFSLKPDFDHDHRKSRVITAVHHSPFIDNKYSTALTRGCVHMVCEFSPHA